ncbi:MAG TPA: YncE family protein, partial [Bryobacteraceae bacterium]
MHKIWLSAILAALTMTAPRATAQFVYVPVRNQGKLSVVNTVTNAITASIPVGATPVAAAINSAGTRVYVCNNGSSTVSVIDTSNNIVVATVPVGNSPYYLAIHPAGTFVYVSSGSSISVIQAATNTVTVTIPTPGGNQGIAVDPTGNYVYVTHDVIGSATLPASADPAYVIDVNTNTLLTSVTRSIVPFESTNLVFSSDATNAYVISPDEPILTVMSTATRGIKTTINLPAIPYSLARSPADGKLYVASWSHSVISAIDPATNSIVSSFGGFSCNYALALAFNPPGTKAYVLCDLGNAPQSLSLQVINISTGALVDTINNVGDNYAQQIAIGGPLASATAQTITFGPLSTITLGSAPVTLTATASSGLQITFTTNSPLVCSVSAATVSFISAGTCSITATQAGNSMFGAALPATQSFLVGYPNVIAFSALSNMLLNALPYQITATASS